MISAADVRLMIFPRAIHTLGTGVNELVIRPHQQSAIVLGAARPTAKAPTRPRRLTPGDPKVDSIQDPG
jgi:hypothetical protein